MSRELLLKKKRENSEGERTDNNSTQRVPTAGAEADEPEVDEIKNYFEAR